MKKEMEKQLEYSLIVEHFIMKLQHELNLNEDTVIRLREIAERDYLKNYSQRND